MNTSKNPILFRTAAVGALIAFIANILDVVLGFGGSEVATYGARTAAEWFAIFQQSGFEGLYTLGIINIIYMLAMVPVYLGFVFAHREKYAAVPALIMTFFVIAVASYIAINAALPMYVLSGRYAVAATDVQKAALLSAGEAVLARGEDFTPGSFLSLFISGLAALSISIVMLRGQVFGKANAWIGIVGFTFLNAFTFLATFVPSLYMLAFYVFGSLGGVLALVWFILTALRFIKLSRVG